MIEAMTAKDSSFQPTLVQSGGRSPTLRIHKGLAAEIGLSESIVLLQLEHLIRISTTEPRDGLSWTYQATRKLQREFFLFWHHSTVNDIINRLEHKRLIEVDNYNRLSFDRTRWIALNYDRLCELDSIQDIELEHRNGKLVPEIVVPNQQQDGPLRVYPHLAQEIGLNETIVLLQLDYLIGISRTVPVDGRAWTRQSTRNLRRESFPWWSESTINRTIRKLRKLKKKGLISVEKHPRRAYDRIRSFALDYERLHLLDAIKIVEQNRLGTQNATRSGQLKTHPTHDSTCASLPATTIPETPTEMPTHTPSDILRQGVTRLDGKFKQGGLGSNLMGKDGPPSEPVLEKESTAHTPYPQEDHYDAPEQETASAPSSQERSAEDVTFPRVPTPEDFLEVLGYSGFAPGIKPKVDAILCAMEQGEMLGDAAYFECERALRDFGESLPVNDLPPIPKSWWYFRAPQAQEHRWLQKNFVSALLNKNALLTHCKYKIHDLGLEESQPTNEVEIPNLPEKEQEIYDSRLDEWEEEYEQHYD